MDILKKRELRLVSGGDEGRWIDTDGDGTPDKLIGCTEDPALPGKELPTG